MSNGSFLASSRYQRTFRDMDPIETYYQGLPMSDGSFLASSSFKGNSRTTGTRDQYPGQTMRVLTQSFTPVNGSNYCSAYDVRR